MSNYQAQIKGYINVCRIQLVSFIYMYTMLQIPKNKGLSGVTISCVEKDIFI